MAEDTLILSLDPSSRRQLGEDGLIVFWRDGAEPGRREGLACTLSTCPHADCGGRVVYLDGYVIDRPALEVCWDDEGVDLLLPEGSESVRIALDEKLIAVVDPATGETLAHPDFPDVADPALLAWLASETDIELLDLLYRFWARAKGHPLEQQRTDIDLDAVEECHLAAFDDFFEGFRNDEYLLGGRRYWTGIFLCPYADCDCHRAHVAFFDEEAESGDTVGSVLIDLRDPSILDIEEMAAECGAPEHLIGDLWALFTHRHDIEPYLRKREAQMKAVGATLWRPVAAPVRAIARLGRNDPCLCGSGRKFKKCCLGKR